MTYNNQGQLTQDNWTVDDGYGGKRTIEYRYTYKNGETASVIQYTNGKLSSKTVHTYKKGKLKSTVTHYYGEFKTLPVNKYVYSYKKGKIRTVKYYQDNTLMFTEKHTWKGKKLKKIVTNYYDGSKCIQTYSYRGGHLKKQAEKRNNFSSVISYDRQGNIIKSVNTHPDGSTYWTTHFYKYYKKKYVKEEIMKDWDGNESKTVYSVWKKY